MYVSFCPLLATAATLCFANWQVKARPPTFVLFINGQSQPPEAFTRFLATRLRSALDFQGVPLRLYYR